MQDNQLQRRKMPSLSNTLHLEMIMALGVMCIMVAFFFYFEEASHLCTSEMREISDTLPLENHRKPIVIVWIPPQGIKFDFKDCVTYYNIDSCELTYDQSLYNEADAIILFHRDIHPNLENLPKAPRPHFQKWIWYHVESPTHTEKTPGLENLFNLTLSYRRDADITVRNELLTKKTVTDEDFVLPTKDKVVCWIVSNRVTAGVGARVQYFNEFSKYVHVNVYGGAYTTRLRYEDFFPTVASCKFYLAFENSIHRDYITEKVNGPLAVGTVPIVLGPPRENYEEFIPPDSFIHINDFPDARSLAEYLLQLDKDDMKYMQYFQWRKSFKATPHLLTIQNEFTQPICLACDHISRDKDYSAVHKLYDWYFSY